MVSKLRPSTCSPLARSIAKWFSPRAGASVGTHTLEIRVLGTAGRPRVDVDAFAVIR